jgi:hypothetical protein
MIWLMKFKIMSTREFVKHGRRASGAWNSVSFYCYSDTPLFSILPRLVRESRVYIAKLHEHDSASHVP